MAPLLEQNFYQPPADYLTPEEPSEVLVDSPLQTSRTTVNTADTMPEQHKSQPQTHSRKASHSPSRPRTKRDAPESNSGLRFMVVEHPDQLKDKAQLRKNRIHVMHNYLAKEAQNPDTKDTRVQRHGKLYGAKRKPSRGDTPPTTTQDSTTLNTTAPSNIFRQDISRLTPAESVRSNSSRDTPEHETNQAAKSRRTFDRRLDVGAAAAWRWHTSSEVDKDGPLVKGIGGYFENSRYMRASIEDIPFAFKSARPGDDIAGNIEPFETWPSFSDPALDVYELKWKCSQRFGSKSLSVHWIPTLLRARHAFLSTLCISSAHDDIMTRAMLPSYLQNGQTLDARWKVRNGVIKMINESLSDPEMGTADETIIAVLHILNSEIMGCNDQSMRIHQTGLTTMVRARGGLEKLGTGGQLAFVLTITQYMIAGLRETTPDRLYVEFASKQSTKIPHDAQRLPESPLYYPPQGFHSLAAALDPRSQMYHLLDILRAITNRFYIENSQHSSSMASPFRTAKYWEYSDETVSGLYGKVFAIQPAAEQDFNSMGERYMFESVRLASLIYAHALANRIPFSKASKQVRSSSSPIIGSQEEPDPMPIQIQKALLRTDVSYCWGHLAGVLFWVTLIAGAAANPGPLTNEDRVGEDEDARKRITAIAVRCCIVLSFEYGQSVLETLKRMVAIETVLGQTESADVTTNPSMDSDIFDSDRGEQIFGPAKPPPLQRGFADFAQEFLSI